ncbi:MAG TPA: nitroreductase family deazaflavin-dependent oxidoreductase [Candidatus Limnocylindrales bacterium]
MSGTRLAFLRPFTTHLFNPLSRRVAGYLPWFGIVIVPGRRSGTIRRVPMNVFRTGDDYVMALTYGRDVDWVKNVLSAGGCRLQTRGRVVELGDPQLVHDPGRRLVPAVVRVFLGLLGVNDFLRLRPVATTPSDRRP